MSNEMQFPSPSPSSPAKRRGRPPRDGVVFVKKDLLMANQNCRSREEDVVSVSQLKKMTDITKKPMSEAQQAHIKNLLEGNAKRRTASKELANMKIPSVVPEGYVPVVVKGKTRVTNGEVTQKQSAIMDMMKAMQDQIKALAEQRKDAREASVAALPVYVAPKPVKPVKEKKPNKKRIPAYQSDTSDSESEVNDSESESDASDSDSEYLKKYQKKAVKRLEAVKEIENKLRTKQAPAPVAKPKGKYDHLGKLF
jgi:hypothetical protein